METAATQNATSKLAVIKLSILVKFVMTEILIPMMAAVRIACQMRYAVMV